MFYAIGIENGKEKVFELMGKSLLEAKIHAEEIERLYNVKITGIHKFKN